MNSFNVLVFFYITKTIMTGTSYNYPVANLVFVRLGKYRDSRPSVTFVSLGTSN